MSRVDVVMATFNRPDQLRRSLAGLQAQTYRDFSVLVVDDASSSPIDAAIADDYAFPLRILRLEENRGPGRARNRGVAECSAELISFIDDDVVPDRLLLERHVAAYDAGPASTAQFGPLSAPADWKPTPWNLWEARTIEHEYGRMIRGEYPAGWRQFFTGNAFLPRKWFLAAGGFDERFTRAEDIEFAYRLDAMGCEFRFVPDAVGWHYARRTRQSWQRIAREYARFDLEISRLHPELNWLAIREREREGRNGLSKFGFAALSRTGLTRPGTWAAIQGARLLHALNIAPPGQPLLSFAYSVEYESAMKAALQAAPTGASARPDPSTGSSPA